MRKGQDYNEIGKVATVIESIYHQSIYAAENITSIKETIGPKGSIEVVLQLSIHIKYNADNNKNQLIIHKH